jgi:hypothetical protein
MSTLFPAGNQVEVAGDLLDEITDSFDVDDQCPSILTQPDLVVGNRFISDRFEIVPDRT